MASPDPPVSPPLVPDPPRTWTPQAWEARLLARSLRAVAVTVLHGADDTDRRAMVQQGLLPLLGRRGDDQADPDRARRRPPLPDRGQRIGRRAEVSERVVTITDWPAPPAALVPLAQRLREAGVTAAGGRAAHRRVLLVLMGLDAALAEAAGALHPDPFWRELVETLTALPPALHVLLVADSASSPGMRWLQAQMPGLGDQALRLERLPLGRDPRLTPVPGREQPAVPPSRPTPAAHAGHTAPNAPSAPQPPPTPPAAASPLAPPFTRPATPAASSPGADGDWLDSVRQALVRVAARGQASEPAGDATRAPSDRPDSAAAPVQPQPQPQPQPPSRPVLPGAGQASEDGSRPPGSDPAPEVRSAAAPPPPVCAPAPPPGSRSMAPDAPHPPAPAPAPAASTMAAPPHDDEPLLDDRHEPRFDARFEDVPPPLDFAPGAEAATAWSPAPAARSARSHRPARPARPAQSAASRPRGAGRRRMAAAWGVGLAVLVGIGVWLQVSRGLAGRGGAGTAQTEVPEAILRADPTGAGASAAPGQAVSSAVVDPGGALLAALAGLPVQDLRESRAVALARLAAASEPTLAVVRQDLLQVLPGSGRSAGLRVVAPLFVEPVQAWVKTAPDTAKSAGASWAGLRRGTIDTGSHGGDALSAERLLRQLFGTGSSTASRQLRQLPDGDAVTALRRGEVDAVLRVGAGALAAAPRDSASGLRALTLDDAEPRARMALRRYMPAPPLVPWPGAAQARVPGVMAFLVVQGRDRAAREQLATRALQALCATHAAWRAAVGPRWVVVRPDVPLPAGRPYVDVAERGTARCGAGFTAASPAGPLLSSQGRGEAADVKASVRRPWSAPRRS